MKSILIFPPNTKIKNQSANIDGNNLVAKKAGNITSEIWSWCEFEWTVKQVYVQHNATFDLPHIREFTG